MKVILNETTRLYQIVKAIQQSGDSVVEFIVPPNSIIKQNPENVDLLQRLVQKCGKSARVSYSETESAPLEESQDPARGSDAVFEAEINEVELATGEVDSVIEEEPVPAKIRGGKYSVSPKKILGIVGLFLLFGLLGGGAYIYYFLPRGSVTLFVEERILERSADIQVSTQIETFDLEQKLIPARVIKTELEKEGTKGTTGQKTVGDQATGTVEINNFTEADLQLAPGTLVISYVNENEILEYSLTEGVTVPRVTVTIPEEGQRLLEAGVADAAVIAQDIGEQYNIPAERKMQIADFDLADVYAANPQPFTGGLTREVSVVAQADQDSLKDELQSQIEAELIVAIRNMIGEDELFEEDNVTYATKFINYSHEVDEETDEVSASMGIEAQVYVMSKADIKALLREDLINNLPEGFEMSSANEVVSVQDTQVEGEEMTIKASIKTLVIPQINTDQLKTELIGKRLPQAEELLRGIEHVEGYDISIWPLLPSFLRSMPHQAERLDIVVEVKQ